MYRRNPRTDAGTGLITPAAQPVREVRWHDLPLSCPMPDASLWNGHPRVYLSIHESGRAQCPYCGTAYVLKDPVPGEEPPRPNNPMIERRYREALRRVRRARGD